MARHQTAGDLLREMRERAKLSRESAAAAVPCSVESIVSYETWRRRPSLAQLARLFDVYQPSQDDRSLFLDLSTQPLRGSEATPVEAA